MGLCDIFNSKPKITTISGCHTIHGIKNLSKRTLRSIQTLCFPKSHKGRLSTEQIIYTCDSVLTQNSRITEDCRQIIINTDNPQIFFERYELLINKYTLMSQYEPFVEFFGYQPLESLTHFKADKGKYEKKLIDRCYNKALIKADSLKTEKGKKNQFVKAYEKLSNYKCKMTSDAQEYLNKKFSSKI